MFVCCCLYVVSLVVWFGDYEVFFDDFFWFGEFEWFWMVFYIVEMMGLDWEGVWGVGLFGNIVFCVFDRKVDIVFLCEVYCCLNMSSSGSVYYVCWVFLFRIFVFIIFWF